MRKTSILALAAALLAVFGIGVVVVQQSHGDRVSFKGRDYRPSDRVAEKSGPSAVAGLIEIGTLTGTDEKVFVDIVSDYAPTVIMVQTGTDSYRQYGLMGGP